MATVKMQRSNNNANERGSVFDCDDPGESFSITPVQIIDLLVDGENRARWSYEFQVDFSMIAATITLNDGEEKKIHCFQTLKLNFQTFHPKDSNDFHRQELSDDESIQSNWYKSSSESHFLVDLMDYPSEEEDEYKSPREMVEQHQ